MVAPWENKRELFCSDDLALCLWRDDRIGQKQSMQRLAQFFTSLDKMPRRDIPFWMVDRLSEWEGAIWDGDDLKIIYEPETVDESFNDDGSFRWISDFLKLASSEPRQQAQRRVLERLRLMTASVAVYEVYLRYAVHQGFRVPISYRDFYNDKFFNEATLRKAQFFRGLAPLNFTWLKDAKRVHKQTGARIKELAAEPQQMSSLVDFIMTTDWDAID